MARRAPRRASLPLILLATLQTAVAPAAGRGARSEVMSTSMGGRGSSWSRHSPAGTRARRRAQAPASPGSTGGVGKGGGEKRVAAKLILFEYEVHGKVQKVCTWPVRHGHPPLRERWLGGGGGG